ncbi:MAG: radical SAM protein [Promethearchaeota archaeon]
MELFVRNQELCQQCGFCTNHISCPAEPPKFDPSTCLGCRACFLGCPHKAIQKQTIEEDHEIIRIFVDGLAYEIPRRITVKTALENLGFCFDKLPASDCFFSPCETGGCYACEMLIDGQITPACHTPVKRDMRIQTKVPLDSHPLRIVSGYMAHSVGGVGTPCDLKIDSYRPIEVAVFSHGCQLRCPTCQNFGVTYGSKNNPSTPAEVASILTKYRKKYHVDRMAISGGEPTLNRRWLIQFFRHLKKLNPDKKARLHLDTNATVLTPRYIDELVKAGITDIGPDLKGIRIETFMEITGIQDKNLAKNYSKTAWGVVEYIADNYYPEQLFMGVGIPYNAAWMSTEEIREMGERIVQINPEIQVTVLDYRPTFRRRDILKPGVEEMFSIKQQLNDVGLKTVLVQTSIGHFK